MQKQTGTIQVKRTFPEMLKGGVICDVVNAEQARIAEEAGACAVMALERVPADIRAQGGVARGRGVVDDAGDHAMTVFEQDSTLERGDQLAERERPIGHR